MQNCLPCHVLRYGRTTPPTTPPTAAPSTPHLNPTPDPGAAEIQCASPPSAVSFDSTQSVILESLVDQASLFSLSMERVEKTLAEQEKRTEAGFASLRTECIEHVRERDDRRIERLEAENAEPLAQVAAKTSDKQFEEAMPLAAVPDTSIHASQSVDALHESDHHYERGQSKWESPIHLVSN